VVKELVLSLLWLELPLWYGLIPSPGNLRMLEPKKERKKKEKRKERRETRGREEGRKGGRESLISGDNCQGSNCGSATYWLCDLGKGHLSLPQSPVGCL